MVCTGHKFIIVGHIIFNVYTILTNFVYTSEPSFHIYLTTSHESLFLLLQLLQRGCILAIQLLPPLLSGMMWSTVMSTSSLPHNWQTFPKALNSADVKVPSAPLSLVRLLCF